MGGPVQSSLHKLINKPNKRRREDDGRDQQPKLKQPSLLSRLAQSSSEQPAIRKASQQHSAAHSEASQMSQVGREHSNNSAERSWTADQQTGLCPVCGLELPGQLLQQHIEEELDLMTDSNDSFLAPGFTDSSRQQPSRHGDCPAPGTKMHRHPKNTARQCSSSQQKVMVLGGDVAGTQSCTGAVRRVRRCQVQAFDHYSNGGGTWDANMLGVEGVTDPENTWEGLGTMSLGQ